MKQNSFSSPPPKLGVHQDSRLISKPKPPKIRIIHLIAPKIINADAADFRELVQALTGKPPGALGGDDQCSNLNKSTKTGASLPMEIKKEEEECDDFLNDFVDLDGFLNFFL